MKYLLLCLALLLSACSSEGMVVDKQRKPDYLTVFEKFKQTDMAKICDDFEDELWDKPSNRNHQVYPFNMDMDMEIVEDSMDNGVYTAKLSCKADVTYSLSSTTFFHEEYEKSAGTLTFNIQ